MREKTECLTLVIIQFRNLQISLQSLVVVVATVGKSAVVIANHNYKTYKIPKVATFSTFKSGAITNPRQTNNTGRVKVI